MPKRTLPKVSAEQSIIVGVLVVFGWIGWRARKGLSIVPNFLADMLGGIFSTTTQGYVESGAILKKLGDAPASQTPTVFEEAGAVLARAAGAESPPELVTRPDFAADPASSGPYLGQPKNVLRVAGKVRFPISGAIVPTKLAADTFDVDAALENQADEKRTGELVLVVREKNILGTWAEASVSGGNVTLEPREFRQVIVRAPNVVGRPFSPAESSVRLRFAGFTLDHVVFRRTYSLL